MVAIYEVGCILPEPAVRGRTGPQAALHQLGALALAAGATSVRVELFVEDPDAVVERARGLLPEAKVLSLYGRSENLCTTTCTAMDDPERALTSDGAALPFSEVAVVDELGEQVPVGALDIGQGVVVQQGLVLGVEDPAERILPDAGFARFIDPESGAVVSYADLPVVWADRTELAQIFQNLIGNAECMKRRS